MGNQTSHERRGEVHVLSTPPSSRHCRNRLRVKTFPSTERHETAWANASTDREYEMRSEIARKRRLIRMAQLGPTDSFHLDVDASSDEDYACDILYGPDDGMEDYDPVADEYDLPTQNPRNAHVVLRSTGVDVPMKLPPDVYSAYAGFYQLGSLGAYPDNLISLRGNTPERVSLFLGRYKAAYRNHFSVSVCRRKGDLPVRKTVHCEAPRVYALFVPAAEVVRTLRSGYVERTLFDDVIVILAATKAPRRFDVHIDGYEVEWVQDVEVRFEPGDLAEEPIEGPKRLELMQERLTGGSD